MSEAAFRLIVAHVKHEQDQEIVLGAPREVVLDRSRIAIGRRPYNDIVLDHISVSGEHAVLEKRGEHYELIDIGSRNGSFVNEARVMRKALKAGDYLGIGIFSLQLVGAGALGKPSQQTHSAQAQVQSSAIRADRIALEHLSGPLSGLTMIVERPIYKLSHASHVAIIARKPQGSSQAFYLTHLEGQQATLLNDEPVKLGAFLLKFGDVIKVGQTSVRVAQVA